MSALEESVRVTVNGAVHDVEVDPRMPLLWVLRDELGLVGTKYGCGVGLCGACSVLIEGTQARSCTIPLGEVRGEVITIEGLGTPEDRHLLQDAWIEHQVAQCGYCQSGQIIAAQALLATEPSPSDEQIDSALGRNLCRCGTYGRIRAAIKTAAARMATSEDGGL